MAPYALCTAAHRLGKYEASQTRPLIMALVSDNNKAWCHVTTAPLSQVSGGGRR